MYYVFATNEELAWVGWYDVSDDGAQVTHMDGDPILITKSHVVAIKVLNKDQVVIQDANGATILNITNQIIDFKLIFQKSWPIDFTILNGVISIGRYLNAFMINFGDY